MYMNFIDWMARTSRKKKKKTYSDYWKLLCICFSLLAQRQMTGNVLEQMRRVQPTVFCSGIVVANRWPVHQHSPTGRPQCRRPPQTETHHEPAGPGRPPPSAMAVYEIGASRAPARPDGVCPTLLFLHWNPTPHPGASELDRYHVRRSRGWAGGEAGGGACQKTPQNT